MESLRSHTKKSHPKHPSIQHNDVILPKERITNRTSKDKNKKRETTNHHTKINTIRYTKNQETQRKKRTTRNRQLQ